MSTPPTQVQSAVAATEAAAATAKAEVSFVRANWGKLSAVVVAAFVLGFIAAHII